MKLAHYLFSEYRLCGEALRAMYVRPNSPEAINGNVVFRYILVHL